MGKSYDIVDCLSEAPTAKLRAELARRDKLVERRAEIALAKAATRQVRNDLTQALRACIVAIENPPGGGIDKVTLEQATRLVFDLSYRCLPGGSLVDRDGQGPTGMDAGWLAVGEDRRGTESWSGVSHKVLDRLVEPLLGTRNPFNDDPTTRFSKENPRLLDRRP